MAKVIRKNSELPTILLALLMLFFIQQPAGADASSCGVRYLAPMPLIARGTKVLPGDWPWHVAVFDRETGRKKELKYICGGTIISEHFILTAAQCVKPEPDRYFIKAGVHQLRDDNDFDREIYNLSEIIIPPQNKPEEQKFMNDIALMRPNRIISFATVAILPICIWPKHDPNMIDILSRSGIVVGFGVDENDELSETLRQGSIKMVEKQKCVKQYSVFYPHLHENDGISCAIGTEAGVNVGRGDSGGGLYFAKNQVWYLRGIVIACAPFEDSYGYVKCDPKIPAIFTDVSKYTTWINEHQRKVDERNLLDLDDCGVDRSPHVLDEMQKPVFNQYPWNVLLEIEQQNTHNTNLVCSGVLIHPRYVLTVGHCVEGVFPNSKLKSVRLGVFNSRFGNYESIEIEQKINHPTYNKSFLTNNLALLKLKHNADTSKPNIKPICLPSSNDYKDFTLSISGWKRNKYTFPKQERDVMTMSSFHTCRNEYEKHDGHLRAFEGVLCAEYKVRAGSQCLNYAPGSPLQYNKRVREVSRYFLVGLTMFYSYDNCHERESNIFLNVTSAAEWIKNTVKNETS